MPDTPDAGRPADMHRPGTVTDREAVAAMEAADRYARDNPGTPRGWAFAAAVEAAFDERHRAGRDCCAGIVVVQDPDGPPDEPLVIAAAAAVLALAGWLLCAVAAGLDSRTLWNVGAVIALPAAAITATALWKRAVDREWQREQTCSPSSRS